MLALGTLVLVLLTGFGAAMRGEEQEEEHLAPTMPDACAKWLNRNGWSCADFRGGEHGAVMRCTKGGEDSKKEVLVKMPSQSSQRNKYIDNLLELMNEQAVMERYHKAGFKCYAPDMGSDIGAPIVSQNFPFLFMKKVAGKVWEKVKFEGILPKQVAAIMKQAKKSGVKGHDKASGNFMFNAGNVDCPVTLLDVPDEVYENGKYLNDKSTWYKNCCSVCHKLTDKTGKSKACQTLRNWFEESWDGC